MTIELTGSRAALMELFSLPQGLPHGSRLGLTGVARKKARQERLHGYQWALRREMADRSRDRFAVGWAKPDEAAFNKRVMRLARKRERQAAR